MLSQNPNIRTDLALESAESVKTSSGLPEGISADTLSNGGFTVTDVKISTDEAGRRISKPKGRYITLEPEMPLYYSPADSLAACGVIRDYVSELIGNPDKIMIVGLGNLSVTPDSLGPRVSKHIFATRHIPMNAPDINYDGLKSVSVVTPGVMGDTGIEPAELIKPLIESIKPETVIVIDSLACSSPGHLGRTIQLTDTGISPGSGVKNNRGELSQKTLGVKTIAIGVPTVADAKDEDGSLTVTSKNIDKLISMSSSLISQGINMSVHPGLDPEELRLLTT